MSKNYSKSVNRESRRTGETQKGARRRLRAWVLVRPSPPTLLHPLNSRRSGFQPRIAQATSITRAKTQSRKGKSAAAESAVSIRFKQVLDIRRRYRDSLALDPCFSSGPPALPVQCCNARQRPIGATPPLLTKQPINQTTNQPAAGPITSQRANQQTSQHGRQRIRPEASRRSGLQPRIAWSGEAQRREMSHTKTRRHEGKSAGTQQKKRGLRWGQVLFRA